MWSPARDTQSRLCCRGGPCYRPHLSQDQLSPHGALQARDSGVGGNGGGYSMRLVPALPKWPGGDRKPHACAHPAQGQKDERTRQRDGGGPATEAETNGAPGERDRQELLLNQDTALKHYCCYYYYLHVREKAGGSSAGKARCHAPPGAAPGAAGSHFSPWQPSYGWRPQPASPQCHHRRPRHAQLSSRTKGRDTRNLDPGSEAEEPALRQGQLWPGPHHPAQAAPPSPSWPMPSGMGREGRG